MSSWGVPGAAYARLLYDVSHCYPTTANGAVPTKSNVECGMWLGCHSASCDTRHDPSDYERDKGGGNNPDTLHPNRDGFIAMYRAIDFTSLVHPLMCGTTGSALAAYGFALVADGTCTGTVTHTYGGDDNSDADWELSGNEHVCRAKCLLLPSCTGYDLSLIHI